METSVNDKCKSFTSLEQSKKLAEILPLESADMYYFLDPTPAGNIYHLTVQRVDVGVKNLPQYDEGDIPCWSLAALLEQLDDEITDEEGNDYNLTIVKESLKYQLYYHDSWGQAEDIETDCYDDMVDACYETILKLHELKML